MNYSKFVISLLCLAPLAIAIPVLAETSGGSVSSVETPSDTTVDKPADQQVDTQVDKPLTGLTGGETAHDDKLPGLKLTEYNPLKVKNKGPEKAEGIIYFIDGLGKDARSRDEFRATYPYVYGFNTTYGWDVIAAKFPNEEEYSVTAIPRSSTYVLERLAEFRKQGYKKVILAGQSWGAWVTIATATRNPGDTLIDALLLTAPANYGTRDIDGKPNPYFALNKTEFVTNIKPIKTPTLAIFFQDDEFDPGGRGPILKETLARNNTPALIIDNPPDFSGHGAGWKLNFAYDFGTCIDSFLKKPANGQCDKIPAPSGADTRSVEHEQDALAAKAKPVTIADLAGKTLIVTSPGGSVEIQEFTTSEARVDADSSQYTLKMTAKDKQICFENACSTIYRMPDGGYVGFDTEGDETARMVPVD